MGRPKKQETFLVFYHSHAHQFSELLGSFTEIWTLNGLSQQVGLEDIVFKQMAHGQGFAAAFQDPVSSAAFQRTKSSRFLAYQR